MMTDVQIAGRKIGKNHPPFMIAEVSANHNGDLQRALDLLEVAKQSGADAVKLQTYTADTLTLNSDLPDFQIQEGPWAGQSLYKLYDEAHMPWEWHKPLFEKAKDLGLIAFSSPFDETAIDFLEDLHVPAYKIASFELLDLPLIEKVAQTGKPMIMSTGMANLDEISEAVDCVRAQGNEQIILLHCVSAYPASPEEANVSSLVQLSKKFNVIAGLSDHTLGVGVSVAAVSLGASVIEKHFTLRRSDGGPDSGFSLEPDELKLLVESCQDAWASIGQPTFKQTKSEEKNAIFRRSLYVVEDMDQGDVFSQKNLRSIRPGFGLEPKFAKEVYGKPAKFPIKKGTALSRKMFD